MADVRIEHVLNCDVDTFWNKIFFNEEFNNRLFNEVLKFHEYKQVKYEEKEDKVERVVEAVPRMGELPAPLKKVIGEGVGYREEGTFDKGSQHLHLNIVPNKMADKITVKGEIYCEPAGDKKCKRIFKADVKAKIFGVGGMLENRLIADMEKSYEVGAKFTNDYIAEKGL